MNSVATQGSSERRLVSVVVPFYERQDQLDRLLAGLDLQTLPAGRFEVVVADDGSRVAPRVGSRGYQTSVVRQADEGFRLAAARNLGAAAAAGDVLVFIDQDCVPAPDYLEKVSSVTTAPWDLTVGHRLHADLHGWTADAVRGWLRGDGAAPQPIDEPAWLLEGYERTADLTRPDDRAYQLRTGTTATARTWPAPRCDGCPTRSSGTTDPTCPAGATSPRSRTPRPGSWRDDYPTPTCAARIWCGRSPRSSCGSTRRAPTLECRWGRWRRAATVPPVGLGDAVASPLEDPRVHAGRPGAAVLARARWLVDCDMVLLHGTTLRELTRAAPVGSPHLRICSTRDANRRSRGAEPVRPRSLPGGVQVEWLVETPVLERHWQSRSTR